MLVTGFIPMWRRPKRKALSDLFPPVGRPGHAGYGRQRQSFQYGFPVDACAETYDEAVTLAESVRTTVDGWERENRIRQEKDLFEVETGLHHVVLEISVWHP